MRRAWLVTAAVPAAVIFFLLATLPPAPAAIDASHAGADLIDRTAVGAYHIHTTRSDGDGDKGSVAAAAARAGLKFAIFTDHGDGTSTPDPPIYLNGVLCIDGVEISTNGGHYVAIDMPKAPYPLGGEAAAVVEDVARLGGLGIAAHPDSAKPELAWSDWRAPVGGIEWLNVDSEWRDESRGKLIRALLDYFIRPAPAMASILDRPEATLSRWETLSRERRVVALAAVDAHGGVRTRLEGRSRLGVGPSYEASFRTLSNHVRLERRLSGEAASDARAVMDAIRRGRVYTVVDALATGAFVDPAAAVPRWPLAVDGRVTHHGPDGHAGWFEVYRDAAPGKPPVPWILTNPVVAPAPSSPPPIIAPNAAGTPVNPEWRIEKDEASIGSLRAAGREVSVRYQLHSGPRASQFVALAGDLAVGPSGQVVFEGRAAAPMRLSVQLRFPGTEQRWVKSVYLDAHPRTVVVPVGELVAADRHSTSMPDPATARSLLFVVDLTNAAPGSSGSFILSDVRLPR